MRIMFKLLRLSSISALIIVLYGCGGGGNFGGMGGDSGGGRVWMNHTCVAGTSANNTVKAWSVNESDARDNALDKCRSRFPSHASNCRIVSCSNS